MDLFYGRVQDIVLRIKGRIDRISKAFFLQVHREILPYLINFRCQFGIIFNSLWHWNLAVENKKKLPRGKQKQQLLKL